ncbi:MAG: tyrosine-type recombinase/integrase [Clostridia bacterium]|nr:tyrosine-type recombinase/integrase [Clostridia bacterium]
MARDYYAERNRINNRKTEEILKDLPPYAFDYFVGVESRTSALTRLNYAYDLRVFYQYLSEKIFKNTPVVEITLEQLESVDAFIFERYLLYLSDYEINGKRSTCDEQAKKRKLASVRSYYKYFYNKGLLESNPASKVTLPKIHDKEIIRLEVNEVVDILNEAERGDNMSGHMKIYHQNTNLRDVALLSLFLGTGIRISELVGLNVDDVDFSSNAFIVTRKGGNRTILYFPEEVADSLYAYVRQRESSNRIPKEEKALFLSLRNKRISVRAVENIVKKYASIVTPLKHITPHKLRSTFGTNLYRETGDIYQVADTLGHKDVNTTKRHYAAISEDNRRKSAKVIKLRSTD